MSQHQEPRNSFEWACGIIAREISGKLYGAVTINFKNGDIVAIKTEKSEIPPVDNNNKTN